MDDDDFDQAWIEGVHQATDLLRSLGVTSISAVGMRMGATIVGTAASTYDLGLSSFVMWDPCESGRTYVRELSALGALGRNVVTSDAGTPTKMLEYALSDEAERRLNRFSLTEPTSSALADRVLVVARDDRPISKKFRARWDSANVDWVTTSEQGSMLETQLPSTVQPVTTIEEIRAWVTTPTSLPTPFSDPPRTFDTVMKSGSETVAVRERVVELGSQRLFGIVTEPVGDVQGPLIVMVNGVNEDHVGPARLWVELSRRWASLGLRCVRFDSSYLGESPLPHDESTRSLLAKNRQQDVVDVVRALKPTDAADSVLIGYCNGARLALEVALELKTRGVCGMNPQVGTGVSLNIDRLESDERESIRSFAQRTDDLLKRHGLMNRMFRRLSQSVRSSALGGRAVSGLLKLSSICPPKVRAALAINHTEILLLLSPEDLSSLRKIPVLGSIVRRRLASSEHFHVEIVPELDHAFLSTLGRERAVKLLDRHVTETLTSTGVK
jgi:dienelactone hydrolase